MSIFGILILILAIPLLIDKIRDSIRNIKNYLNELKRV